MTSRSRKPQRGHRPFRCADCRYPFVEVFLAPDNSRWLCRDCLAAESPERGKRVDDQVAAEDARQ